MCDNCRRAVGEGGGPPNAESRVSLAGRALLVRGACGRRNLCEAGIGAFFEPKMRERFGVVEAEHVLLRSLAGLGVAPAEVDVIVLSHLHFDHVGGILAPWEAGREIALAFPNASYVVGQAAWARAKEPHARDRASFIPGLCDLLEATGRLEQVAGRHSRTLGGGYTFTFSEGHTPGLMLARIVGGSAGPVTFLGDLIPGAPWVHLPITMGYDRFPELLIEEKEALLSRVVADDEWVFFTHDPAVAAAKVRRDAKGRYQAEEAVAAVHWD